MQIKKFDPATGQEESYVWVEVWSKSGVRSLFPDLDGRIEFFNEEQKRSRKNIFSIPERFTYSEDAVQEYMVERFAHSRVGALQTTIPQITKIKVKPPEQQNNLNRYELYGEEISDLAKYMEEN